MTTLERLQSMLARDIQIEAGALVPAATLESLDIDYLLLLEFHFCLEEDFGITVSAEQAEIRARVHTLGDLAAFVDEQLAGGRAAPA